ncbi:MAG: hypothetical protein DDT39_00911 [Firmicutes bacterium]|nr:hypothetical protein [candidate division NPL-UPA2 bacterium]
MTKVVSQMTKVVSQMTKVVRQMPKVVRQMPRILLCLAMVMLCVPQAYGIAGQHQIIRLHVVAHNNTADEQGMKLALRDVLLAEVDKLLSDAQSSRDATTVIMQNLSQLEALASMKLQSLGSPHGANLLWGNFLFPTRTYRQVVLPYVRIGEGQGRNWWCIMFPPLCYVPGVTRQGEGLRFEFALLNLLRGLWRRMVAN